MTSSSPRTGPVSLKRLLLLFRSPAVPGGGESELGADPTSAGLTGADLLDPGLLASAERFGVTPYLAGLAASTGAIPAMPDAAVRLMFAAGSADRTWSPAAVLAKTALDQRDLVEDLDHVLATATAVLAGAGIESWPLKGMALAKAGVWPDPSWRTIKDVDLLVDPSRADQAQLLLIAAGFVPTTDVDDSGVWDDDHQRKPLVLPGRLGSIEVHAHTLVRRYRGLLPTGAPVTPAAVARHIIVHAQLQDEAYALLTLPLTGLLDVATMCERDPELARRLVQPHDDPTLARVVRYHVYCAQRLRSGSHAGSTLVRGHIGFRIRYALSLWLADRPAAALLWHEVRLGPRGLDRAVMESRVGRPLTRRELLRERVRFVLSRGRRSLADLRAAREPR